MTDNKLIFTKVCNSEKNMTEIYKLLFSNINKNKKSYLLIGHGTPYYHNRLRKVLGPKAYIISIEDESFKRSWKCLTENEDVFFINMRHPYQLECMMIFILTNIIKMKKFDCIIANPPYDDTLHLDIITKCLDHLSDDGEMVNISPIGWVLDPLKEDKPGSAYLTYNKVVSYLEDLKIYSAEEMTKLFNANQWNDLAIYLLSKKGGFDTSTLIDKFVKYFVERVIIPTRRGDNLLKHWTKKRGECDFSRPFVKVSELHGNKGKADMYEFISDDSEIAFSKKGGSCAHTFNFDTQEEAQNFFDSLNTSFVKFIGKTCKVSMNVPWSYLMWMDDYTRPWTTHDFCEYFGLSSEDEKHIKEVMSASV